MVVKYGHCDSMILLNDFSLIHPQQQSMVNLDFC